MVFGRSFIHLSIYLCYNKIFTDPKIERLLRAAKDQMLYHKAFPMHHIVVN